jgi:hypothetical protein
VSQTHPLHPNAALHSPTQKGLVNHPRDVHGCVIENIHCIQMQHCTSPTQLGLVNTHVTSLAVFVTTSTASKCSTASTHTVGFSQYPCDVHDCVTDNTHCIQMLHCIPPHTGLYLVTSGIASRTISHLFVLTLLMLLILILVLSLLWLLLLYYGPHTGPCNRDQLSGSLQCMCTPVLGDRSCQIGNCQIVRIKGTIL